MTPEKFQNFSEYVASRKAAGFIGKDFMDK